jgi:hypothetical protein
MPQEILVSSSLKVGETMPGIVKHFVGRRERRTPVPITLLSATQLRIGDNDVRQIICAVTESGQTSYLVNSVTAAAEAAWLAEAQLNRASALLRDPDGDPTTARRGTWCGWRRGHAEPAVLV